MQGFNWDDIRFFLAIAQSRSLAQAAESLEVNQSTVSRRIAALERSLDTALFDRAPNSSWVLSMAGEQILGAAEQMRDNAQQIGRDVLKNARELSGTIKVTCGDAGMQAMLVQTIAGFSKRYPGIELSIVVSNEPLDLATREADVAIRVTPAPPPNVVGKRICTLGLGVYASPELAERYRAGDRDLPVIVNMAGTDGRSDWISRYLPDHTTTHSCNSLPGKVEAALQGIGATAIPVAIGEETPGLQRLFTYKPDPEPGLWVLSHVDLRSTARVRAFRDYLVEKLSAKADRIAGVNLPAAA
ncbi:MAG: LysR family transcriptional regulator [Pseudomonadota bacterium]